MLKNPSAKYAVSGPVANPLLGGDIAPVDGSVEGPTHGEIEGGLAREELEVGEKSPQDEVLIPVPVPVPVPRSVDLNLFEKVWMLLEFCQLHSLLLVASFQFWPPRYLEVMKGLAAAVNLDFVLWRQEFFMEWRGFEGKYKDYAMMMCIAPALVYGSFRVLEGRFRLGRRLLFMRLEAAVVMVLDFLLLPLLLAFSRLFQCVPVSNIKAVTWTIEYESFDGMEVDREAECAGSDYWFAAFVVGLTCLGVAKFLLSFYYRSTVTATTYKSQIDHSKMMVRFELEWMLGLGEDWAWGGMWSISSWERRGRFLHIAAFVTLYDNRPLLGACLWVLALVGCVYTIALRPFRTTSSNICRGILDMVHIFNCTMLVFNVQEMRSAITLPSRQVVGLSVVNGFGIAAFLGVVISMWAGGEAWPAVGTLEKLKGQEKFPKWLDVVTNANRVMGMCGVGCVKVAPLDLMEAEMRRVRNCYLQALKEKSIFSITLNSTLEEMARIHERLRGESLLPGRELADTLRETGGLIVRRRYFQSLMSPQKRRILLKLLAVKNFIGERKIEKLWDWETQLLEDGEVLTAEGAELLGEAVETELAFSEEFMVLVEELGRKWKRLIKNWEKMYTLFNCAPPDKEEKKGRVGWYMQYKGCGNAAKNLRKGWPFVGLENDFGEKMEKTMEEGGVLVGQCWGSGSLVGLEKVEGDLKGLLKEFESAWEESFGKAMELKVKRAHEAWYKMYRELKKGRDSLRKWEKESKRLNKKWEEEGLQNCCVYSSDGRLTELCVEIGGDWKALIKEWIDEYKGRIGKDVSSDDKRGWRGWYESYGKSRAKTKEIEGGIKTLEKLQKKTDKLLRKGGSRADILKAKTAWKGHIKKWENQFMIEHGAKAAGDDKEMIEEWYVMYQELAKSLLAIEMDMLKEKLGGEGGGDDGLGDLGF
ncbi:hypothetical protein TrRE_jg10642 [Triparma retinervis]|uniref:Uncharacterized protein n=1 Tax=Triparma retinervis TaxID=2557542 RepID=A0A9W7CGX2_9STRA|nr:hypothetical protein TrRE_jg10642 [Triparma retinervis]